VPTARVPVTAASPSRHWYALRVKGLREFAVRDDLRQAGIEEFLATFVTESRYSDRIATVQKPLFPTYTFARFDPAQRGAILAIRGVFQILSIDSKPAQVPDAAIEDLQRVCLSRKTVACHAYVVGASVTVSRGCFAGVTGVVSRVNGETTLYIPVEILGRSLQIPIDARDVEPA
jgi:transcriptional antiterminator RfaH